MKILSLEESKKIASKFLKRFNEYSQQGNDLYFNQKPSLLKKLFWELGCHYISGSVFINCDPFYYDEQNQREHKCYENNIEFSRIKLYNYQKEFLFSLEKALGKKSIYGEYLSSKYKLKNLNFERRLIDLTANEIKKSFNLFCHNFLCLFTNNDDFCFFNFGEAIILSGSQKFMSKFRNNFHHTVDCLYTDDLKRSFCLHCGCK